MNKTSSIFVAGHRGLVGSALVRKLRSEGYDNLILKTRDELNLENQQDVMNFFIKERPEYVFLAAAKVGGILANISKPAEFIHSNLLIQSNVIHAACQQKVKKLLFISSSCCYPRLCSQPMKEEYILTGAFEPTNECYAIAKVCGMKMIEAYNKQYGTEFISLMFPNIYGIGDSFDLNSSHVVSALIRKMHEAKIDNLSSVEIWGTGYARREFLFADDAADACMFFMKHPNNTAFLNVGAGEDICIKELALLIKEIVCYKGALVFNTSKPDGMPQKLLDVARMNKLGWQQQISLAEGIKKTYQWFIEQGKEY